jgi:hypothetical protein
MHLSCLVPRWAVQVARFPLPAQPPEPPLGVYPWLLAPAQPTLAVSPLLQATQLLPKLAMCLCLGVALVSAPVHPCRWLLAPPPTWPHPLWVVAPLCGLVPVAQVALAGLSPLPVVVAVVSTCARVTSCPVMLVLSQCRAPACRRAMPLVVTSQCVLVVFLVPALELVARCTCLAVTARHRQAALWSCPAALARQLLAVAP